ncbi:MAG: stage II sporulation protein M [Candidatus Parvarchaeota archaeon]|nr:stage II sporulation protein M [Candidatus Jingweiarchaeum tengchongense]MCW1297896.1 stage II sporulation protein M [Candidatus Jingweiarchaeum tengchongense]MCW1299907.1 stage II sporulation protein M [Candidatus Jingweiarchaeum tengchongense]MCW1305089.1 stage II sporulation protein M [Candidatus Jingweiarchaeum tengchongense]MCW1305151.1 stage II sporulation protein M [Candidatus Jingweiarchaeum tengchongense]
MVIELLISTKKIEKNPWKMFILGFVYVFVAVFFAMLIFSSSPSLPVVFLTTMASIPLLANVLLVEEKKEMKEIEKKEFLDVLRMEDREKFEKIEKRLLKRIKYPLIKTHTDIFTIFLSLFFGFFFAFLIIAIILPQSSYESIFASQISTIKYVRGKFTASAISQNEAILTILSNNFKVLFFCLLLSLFYGAGAIFVLAWNSSVVAAAIGDFIRNEIARHVSPGLTTYFRVLSLGLSKYMFHGTFEMIAFFLASIAGGIISAAVIRHDYKSKEFMEVLLDSVDLIAVASLLLIVAALIEVQGL